MLGFVSSAQLSDSVLNIVLLTHTKSSCFFLGSRSTNLDVYVNSELLIGPEANRVGGFAASHSGSDGTCRNQINRYD